MSRADRDAIRAEMQADRSGWKSSMKADRDAYRAEMRSARSDDAYRADTHSARSDTFTSMSTDTSHRSDTTSGLASELYLSSNARRSELQHTNSVSSSTSEDREVKRCQLSNKSQFADELKADWNKLMVYGKAKMNIMCQNSKEVFVRAMAKDQCDCQLKDFYKCVDEDGSNKEKCRLFMEKMFECRKNLKKADSQS